MSIKSNHKNVKETILIIVGSLLLIISLILFHYNKILEISNEIYNDIQARIFKEETSLNSIQVDIDVDYVVEDSNVEESTESTGNPNYIGFLEIDKIGLRQGLLPKNSYYNKVDYHVQILDLADFPDVVGGNFILAGHSGTSNVAYFRNLYKLKLEDTAKVYYQSKIYMYKIVNIYNEDKDGALNIYRDPKKTTMTLITCTKDDKNHQTVYILELMGVESY